MIYDAEKVGANQLYICDLKYSLSSSFAPKALFIKLGKNNLNRSNLSCATDMFSKSWRGFLLASWQVISRKKNKIEDYSIVNLNHNGLEGEEKNSKGGILSPRKRF